MNEINLDVNDALQKTVNDLEKGAMALDDKGHMQLMTDLKSFLVDAEAGKYHDFHPNGHKFYEFSHHTVFSTQKPIGEVVTLCIAELTEDDILVVLPRTPLSAAPYIQPQWLQPTLETQLQTLPHIAVEPILTMIESLAPGYL